MGRNGCRVIIRIETGHSNLVSCFGPRIRALARYFTSAFASVKYLSQRPHPRAKTWHKIWMTGLNPANIKLPREAYIHKYHLPSLVNSRLATGAKQLIKLNSLSEINIMSEHPVHLTSLPIGFRTWLRRFSCLLMLIVMLWQRQEIFECRIWGWEVWNTKSQANWMPTELSRIKQKPELNSPSL